jgi:hypothetical protein
VCILRRFRRPAVLGFAGAIFVLSAHFAHSEACKPRHFRPPFVVKSMGPCKFDPTTLRFAGTPVDQARCLMRGMDRTRNLATALPVLPPALASRIGSTDGLPPRGALSRYLASRPDLQGQFGVYLPAPLSSAGDDDATAPLARYFVIHDTSGPRYGHRSFPDDINTTSHINNLKNFECGDGWGKAHVVVSRTGAMLLDHDFQIPWRETKFELAANFAGALKGLFLHIELIQPRRGARNDARSPDPAFTVAQYDALALLYTIASVRRGEWLIPAFHAAIDGDIPNGHDDPLNFDIASFAESVDRAVEMLNTPAELQAAIEAAAQNPPAEAATAPSDQPNSAAAPSAPAAAVQLADADPAQVHPSKANKVNGEDMVAPDRGNTSEPKSREPKNGGLETRRAESCHQTRLAKGHRLRRCRYVAAARHERAHARKRHDARNVRSMGRRIPRQGRSARHHRGDLHAGHDRHQARHDRA